MAREYQISSHTSEKSGKRRSRPVHEGHLRSLDAFRYSISRRSLRRAARVLRSPTRPRRPRPTEGTTPPHGPFRKGYSWLPEFAHSSCPPPRSRPFPAPLENRFRRRLPPCSARRPAASGNRPGRVDARRFRRGLGTVHPGPSRKQGRRRWLRRRSPRQAGRERRRLPGLPVRRPRRPGLRTGRPHDEPARSGGVGRAGRTVLEGDGRRRGRYRGVDRHRPPGSRRAGCENPFLRTTPDASRAAPELPGLRLRTVAIAADDVLVVLRDAGTTGLDLDALAVDAWRHAAGPLGR